MSSGDFANHSSNSSNQFPSSNDLLATILADPAPLPLPNSPKTFLFPAVGTVIRSPHNRRVYTIGVPIGSGSFSVVYGAEDNWGNKLAVKVFRGLGTYEEIGKQALDEAVKLYTLRNTHITYVHDIFEFGNAFYIVSERCGLPVSSMFSDDQTGWVLVKPLARCLFQALQFIHDNGYVHQDIHSRNVFIHWSHSELVPDQSTMSFKVGDLGLAKPVKLMNPQNTLLAGWMMPPEVLEASYGPMDHRLDLYHAALLLLQLHVGKELRFTKEEILGGAPRSMAEGLGPLGEAISLGLRRHVESRPTTAMAFWEEIKTVSP
jgi:serine/threonine protein kinase